MEIRIRKEQYMGFNPEVCQLICICSERDVVHWYNIPFLDYFGTKFHKLVKKGRSK